MFKSEIFLVDEATKGAGTHTCSLMDYGHETTEGTFYPK